MKKLFAIAALVLALVLVLQLVSFACEPPPPPPPCEPADCSPGFWKNHTFWMADYTNAEDMLDALRAKGNSPLRPLRQPTADILNAAYPNTICD